MTTAANNVQVSVKFSGVDGVSKAAKSAQGAVTQFGSAAQAASQRVRGIGSAVGSLASGNVIGGVKDLASSLGTGAGGLAATAGAAVVGIGAIGAAAAVAAVKITQLTYETNRLSAQADAAFGAKGGLSRALDIAADVGGVGAENIVKLQAVLQSAGVSARFTTQQLQELAGRATQAGKSGDDALQALARAIETGRGNALRSVGTFVNTSGALAEYARQAGISADQIDEVTRRQIVADEIARSLSQTVSRLTTTYDQQDAALAVLGNETLRLKVALAEAIGGEAAAGVETLTDFVRAVRGSTDGIVNLIKVALIPARAAFAALQAQIGAASAIIVAVTERDFGKVRAVLEQTRRDLEQFGNDAAADVAKLGDGWNQTTQRVKSAAVETVNAFGLVNDAIGLVGRSVNAQADAAGKAQRAAEKRRAAAQRAASQARQASQAAIAAEIDADRKRIELAEQTGATIEDLYEARIELINKEAAAATAAAQRAVNTAQGRADAILAIEINAQRRRLELQQQIDAQRAERIAAEKAEIDELVQYALDQQAKIDAARAQARQAAADLARQQLDAAVQSVAAVRQEVGALDSLTGNVLATLPQLGAAVAVGFSDSKDAILSATQLAGAALIGLSDAEGQRAAAAAKSEEERAAALEAAERRKAGILALVSAATAALEFARKNYAGAAAAGAAAVQYAAIAGGAVSRVKSGAATAGAGATTGTGETLTTAAADTGASTAAINVSFGSGFVIGTQQQIGQAIAGSLRSLRTTGLATAGGV